MPLRSRPKPLILALVAVTGTPLLSQAGPLPRREATELLVRHVVLVDEPWREAEKAPSWWAEVKSRGWSAAGDFEIRRSLGPAVARSRAVLINPDFVTSANGNLILLPASFWAGVDNLVRAKRETPSRDFSRFYPDNAFPHAKLSGSVQVAVSQSQATARVHLICRESARCIEASFTRTDTLVIGVPGEEGKTVGILLLRLRKPPGA